MQKADRQIFEEVERRHIYREAQIDRKAIPVTQEHSDVGSLLQIVKILVKENDRLAKRK